MVCSSEPKITIYGTYVHIFTWCAQVGLRTMLVYFTDEECLYVSYKHGDLTTYHLFSYYSLALCLSLPSFETFPLFFYVNIFLSPTPFSLEPLGRERWC